MVFRAENFRMESEGASVLTGEHAMLTTHDHVKPN